MKAILFAALVVLAAAIRDSDLVLDNTMIAEINAANGGWTAGLNARFAGLTWGEARALCGTVLRGDDEELPPYPNTFVGVAPDDFDSAEQWPQCVDEINKVLDQGQCGSCWAFGATEGLESRRCIACGGVVEDLSEQDLVSCDKSDYGCQGGYLDHAWKYLTNTGTVSDACYPYTSGTSGQTGTCQSSCPGEGDWEKHCAKVGTMVQPRRVADIQAEIMKNGPIECGFTVYQDFFSYTDGVYRHKSGGMAGGHAVLMTGWGVADDGTPYWLIKNSWGPNWGLGGFFKILRGSNECGIESNVVGSVPAC